MSFQFKRADILEHPPGTPYNLDLLIDVTGTSGKLLLFLRKGVLWAPYRDSTLSEAMLCGLASPAALACKAGAYAGA